MLLLVEIELLLVNRDLYLCGYIRLEIFNFCLY